MNRCGYCRGCLRAALFSISTRCSRYRTGSFRTLMRIRRQGKCGFGHTALFEVLVNTRSHSSAVKSVLNWKSP